MSQFDFKPFYERHLPHYQPPGATLFLSFRLADSIPKPVLFELQAEADRVDRLLATISDPEERSQQALAEKERLFYRWDDALDGATSGPLWLQEPAVASLVVDALHHRHGQVYDLEAFCIMPNHVHAVFTPLAKPDDTYHSLASIMHSLKLWTGRNANQLLGRQGGFWQHENYDHVVRNEAALMRIIRYVLNNPVKAGLVGLSELWPWSYCRELRSAL